MKQYRRLVCDMHIRMDMRMITWNKRLYFGESIKKKHRKAIRLINKRKPVWDVFCIAFAQNPQNLLEVFEAKEFLFPAYQRMDFHILGLAGSRDEAFELVVDMLMEVYEVTGEFEVREYFKDK